MGARFTRLGSIAALATGFIVAACGSFLAADEAPPEADDKVEAGGPPDGPGPTPSSDDAADAGGDAMTSDAALTACSALAPVFEDDFASGAAPKWNYATAGCTAGDLGFEAHAPDMAVVASCTAPAPEAFRIIQTGELAFGSAKEIAFSFRIAKHQEGLVFAQVLGLFGLGANLGFAYLASPPTIALYETGGQAPLTSWPTTVDTDWHEARLALDRGDAGPDVKITVVVDGATRTFTKPRDVGAGESIRLQLGVFHPHVGLDAAAAYDDVKIWSCP